VDKLHLPNCLGKKSRRDGMIIEKQDAKHQGNPEGVEYPKQQQ